MAPNRLSNRAGTSLAEVLVVVVILVTGILVVMRVFPVGFGSLRHAENVSIAGRLAQHEMEKWHNRAANLPAGILPIIFNPAINQNELILDLVPGPPFDATGALGRNSECFRRVIGEVTRVPVGTYYDLPGSEDIAAMYVLGFSPIDIPVDSGTGEIVLEDGHPKGLLVYGGSMRGQQYDSTDSDIEPWKWLGSRYGIDYDRGKICFQQSSIDRSFRISYSYWTNTGTPTLKHVLDQVITVPQGAPGWVDFLPTPLPGDFGQLDEGSETVARAFKYLAPTDSFTDDPYEYKLVDRIIGILAFNPRGYAYQESTEMGSRALEAHVDYDILDLQIISEEKTIPSSAPYNVKLTLPFLKEKGRSVETDNTDFVGLGRGKVAINYSGTIVSPDVLVVNPADGAILYPRSVDSPVPNPNFVIDADGFKTGTVKFLPDATSGLPEIVAIMPSGAVINNYNIAGKTLRFYYQADNDWSIQVQKAYEGYTERDPAFGLGIDYKQFVRDPGTTSSQKLRLLFKPCDAEKTVAVTYKWIDEDEIIHTEIAESHQLSPDQVTVTDPVSSAPMKFVYLDLNHALSEVTEISLVAGVSIKARVLWRERNQWIRSDVDSSLTRRPTEL